jgi:peptide/nickel transport system permease protein
MSAILERRPAPIKQKRWSILSIIAIVVASTLVVLAVLASWIAPYDPDAGDVLSSFGPPSPEHLLGTDSAGRDILSRLLIGARSSLLGGAIVTVLAASLGTFIGIASAWKGGRVDAAVSGALAVLFAFPGIIAALIAASLFGPSLTTAIIAITIPMLPSISRVVRAEALRQIAMPYIESARVQGLSVTRICFGHVLPNVAPVIVAQIATIFGFAMMGIASLSYLGLGVRPPTSDWGVMISSGQSGVIQGHPEESLFAGIALVITITAFTVSADAIAARLDRGKAS